MYENVLDNLKTIREKISTRPVTLLAVTKTVPAEVINRVIDQGIDHIGENRVQELLQKYDQLHRRDQLHIHLIGSLQTNKVKYIIDKVELIESLDSERLAREIQKQAQKIGKIQDVLIEINIGGEESKGGIPPEQLPSLLETVRSLPNVRFCGLMCIPPRTDDRERLTKYFLDMKKLLVDNRAEKIDNINDYILSMGMSHDYEIAMDVGATQVRIGSALFGDRK